MTPPLTPHERVARGVIQQLEAHHGVLLAAIDRNDLEAIKSSAERISLLAKRLEEFFIRLGYRM